MVTLGASLDDILYDFEAQLLCASAPLRQPVARDLDALFAPAPIALTVEETYAQLQADWRVPAPRGTTPFVMPQFPDFPAATSPAAPFAQWTEVQDSYDIDTLFPPKAAQNIPAPWPDLPTLGELDFVDDDGFFPEPDDDAPEESTHGLRKFLRHAANVVLGMAVSAVVSVVRMFTA
ncbi:MAG: hypothetical protein LBN05_06750 [Oscillospiraceae bacterium]|nr:hypothetical protein [Oscillospiraceae bacterium]